MVVTVDGENAVQGEGKVTFEDGDEDGAAEELGLRVARELLGRGAQKLLDAIRFQKEDHLEKGTDVVSNDDVVSDQTVVEIAPTQAKRESDKIVVETRKETNGQESQEV